VAKKDARIWDGGNGFRDRLEVLIRKTGSRYAFAQSLGIGTSHVSKWCDDGVVPGGEMLASIAAHFDLSLNWLICGAGPMLRDQIRTDTKLAADVARHVEREVTKRHPPQVGTEARQWIVSGAYALAVAVDEISPYAVKELARANERARLVPAVDALLETVVEMVDALGPVVERRISAQIAQLQRLAGMLLEQLTANLDDRRSPVVLVSSKVALQVIDKRGVTNVV